MPSSCCSYGHNAHGINLQNLRGLSPMNHDPATNILPGGLRTDHAWRKEVEQAHKDRKSLGHLSARLRDANHAAKEAAEEQIADGVGRVEAALRAKLGQVQMQAGTLQDLLRKITTELVKLSHSAQRVAGMQQHLEGKLAVNRGRQEVRRDRPVRELTCDDVNRSLARQEALLGGLMQKLQRGAGLVAADMTKLQDIKYKLSVSLKDKLSALQVDEAVLSLTAASGLGAAGSCTATGEAPAGDRLPNSACCAAATTGSSKLQAATLAATRAACGGLYPSSWQRQTNMLVADAQQQAADSSRLRQAVKKMLAECLLASQAACQQVDAALASKMSSTADMRGQLAAQLQHVQEEIKVAEEHKDALKESLRAKRYPLEQLEARLAVRSNRPAAEAVEDEVQAALAAEAAQLSAVRSQLQARATAAAQHVAHLNSVSAALLQHIADKGQALSLEEKVALMDGRKLVAVPPSPTVLSVASSVVSGYSCLGESASQISATPSQASILAGDKHSGSVQGPANRAGSSCSSALLRIADLEKELAAAKDETAQLRALVGSKGLETGRPGTSVPVKCTAVAGSATSST